MQLVWVPVIGYGPPSLLILSKGWIGFTFRSDWEAVTILKGSWFWGTSFLLIPPWHFFLPKVRSAYQIFGMGKTTRPVDGIVV